MKHTRAPAAIYRAPFLFLCVILGADVGRSYTWCVGHSIWSLNALSHPNSAMPVLSFLSDDPVYFIMFHRICICFCGCGYGRPTWTYQFFEQLKILSFSVRKVVVSVFRLVSLSVAGTCFLYSFTIMRV